MRAEHAQEVSPSRAARVVYWVGLLAKTKNLRALVADGFLMFAGLPQSYKAFIFTLWLQKQAARAFTRAIMRGGSERYPTTAADCRKRRIFGALQFFQDAERTAAKRLILRAQELA